MDTHLDSVTGPSGAVTLLADKISLAALPTELTWIDGEGVSGSGEPFDTLFPATGELLATVSSSSPEEVVAALEAARRALPAWRRVDAAVRASYLERLADNLVADVERLSALVTLDNGKTIGEGRADVYASAALIRSAAGWAVRGKGTTLPPEGGLTRMTWREPVGVVSVLMPFNAPLMFAGMKIAAAISTGNTVVAKAPERTPLAVGAFMQHVQAVGIPAGVVNLVQGHGQVGAQLVDHESVDMVSFTGSSKVGAQVGSAAVGRLKRVLLELGGKSANIVYDDAPRDLAVQGSLGAIFRNAGQRCFSGSRLLVQDGIFDDFMADYVHGAQTLTVGDPFDLRTQVGALISTADVTRVQDAIAGAVQNGARVLTGGEPPAGVHPGGAFLAPTVVDATSCSDDFIVREELFGPVVVVQRFADEDEALQLANSSSYALAGGCWTNDVGRALRTAREVDTGYFWVNSYGTHGGAESTIGGRGLSGFGQEMGEDGVLGYTVLKSVQFDSGDGAAVVPM